MNSTKNILNLGYFSICLVAVLITFLLHESVHYLAGMVLGYDMEMTLNSVNLADGQTYSKVWHNHLVSISGPIFTIIQAIIFYNIILKTKNLNWYPFLFVAFIMRLMASVISFIGVANDEARVSEWLGIGKMTLPIIVTLFLFWLCFKASQKVTISWKVNLVTFVNTSFGITVIVYLNQYFFK
ncbi:hypothetical protein [Winogradskyella jejuensis]|uniref:Peptidase family M50 n=1 Tax=Winogradskyella jejuensis TaxID=1089305 RepID=A0A1M5JNF4_9FLAO|nr:hypothetical protein [Winogradskyella jejuensis]SHG42061.1 hypothetical protein SAMN05444148_0092 [Winogradskyella jejuensis]